MNVQNIGLKAEVAPPYQVIKKKLKMDHLGFYTLHDVSYSTPQRLQNVIKGGHAGYWTSEYMYLIEW